MNIFVIMFVLILFTHRENVKRLINKEESKTKFINLTIDIFLCSFNYESCHS